MAEPVASAGGRGQLDQDAITPAEPSSSSPGKDDVRQSCTISEKAEMQDVDDDEEKVRRIADQDFEGQRKQTYSGFVLLWLSWQSTGVIYGDIGTSPLYVWSSTFSSQPSWDDLVGALSILLWSLTLIVTVKYTFIVLSADDDGQGGTFAIYSLLARYMHITEVEPSKERTLKMERYLTGDMKPVSRGIRSFIENSSSAKFTLKVIGVLGVSMIMADGVLTPAQSVLGAIQGITVANPNLTTSPIVGISCTILVLLFLVQPMGTSRLGTTFAPIVTVWLLFNLASGIYNLAVYDYTVLKAFSPYFAFAYLVRNGYDGWKSLGGLLLAFTGVEALFADLGAFSKRAIQLSWLCLAYPCLMVAYIGQAAYISSDATQTAFSNPFFRTVPPGTLYFSLVLAVLAAIVASQAMITSTFQLLVQVMRMSYFPHIKVVHTSKRFHEQVYMPMANWLLMIGTVIVTAVYNNTTSLGNAYGVCVIIVTFITTCMVSLVAILIWRTPIWAVLPVFLFFAGLDGVYLSSVLTKVPDGAWFTLLLAVLLSGVFILWRFGKEAQWRGEWRDRQPVSGMLADGGARLVDRHGGLAVSTVPGLGIFFDKAGDAAAPATAAAAAGPVLPPSFAHFVRKFAARPAVVVFFHMRPLPRPHVPPAERYVVARAPGLPAAYAVVLRHGYADADVLRPGVARDLVAQIELVVARSSRSSRSRSRSPTAEGDPVEVELAALRSAAAAQTVYVLGKEALRVRRSDGGDTAGGGVSRPWAACRRALLAIFLWIRENSRTKLADLHLDADKLVEVGFVGEI